MTEHDASSLATGTLDTAAVRRSFDRAAPTFDAAAVLHAEVRGNLLARLDFTKLAPRVVIDAGAGTGHGARALKQRYPNAQVIAVDLSQRMLQVAARRRSWLVPFMRVCAHAGRLPFADGSIDLIVSNLMLPWCSPDDVLAECRRVLAPRGLLSFTTFGPDTLRELRDAWAQVDKADHVGGFIDMHDIGDALVRSGFASPVLDVERFTLQYRDVRQIAADLKATGSRNPTFGRPKGLASRRKLAALQTAYEFHRHEGRLPATCEVVFAHAWSPTTMGSARGEDGSTVSLDEIKRQLRLRSRS